MTNLIEEKVAEARRGENPTALCQMPSGWAVIGYQQFIPGYCLLLSDPVVADLNALKGAARIQFLLDMALIGDALLEVTDSYRINYEILGNSAPALHAHIFPRYLSESEIPRSVPVWVGYAKEEYESRPLDLDRDQEIMQAIATAIQRRL
jgi:diadenosine tetraphosphate (Ap4A) HIT family hydrolase